VVENARGTAGVVGRRGINALHTANCRRATHSRAIVVLLVVLLVVLIDMPGVLFLNRPPVSLVESMGGVELEEAIRQYLDGNDGLFIADAGLDHVVMPSMRSSRNWKDDKQVSNR
jgi:hypothetical protein